MKTSEQPQSDANSVTCGTKTDDKIVLPMIRRYVLNRPKYRSRWKIAIMTALEANGVVGVGVGKVADYIEINFPNVPRPAYWRDKGSTRRAACDGVVKIGLKQDIDKIRTDLLKFYRPLFGSSIRSLISDPSDRFDPRRDSKIPPKN